MSFEHLRIQLSGTPDLPDSPLHYLQALEALGAKPEWQYMPKPDLTCDGLLICGGPDIHPSNYGQECGGAVEMVPERDAAELELIRAFSEAGKPVFGICRGMQLINVFFGGDMIQDLGSELNVFHKSIELDQVHALRTAEDSIIRDLYGEVFTSNSYHHQAVARIGKGLRATAWAEAGFPEAIEHETLPMFAVQFHPERMTGELLRPDAVDGGKLFRHFLELCAAQKG